MTKRHESHAQNHARPQLRRLVPILAALGVALGPHVLLAEPHVDGEVALEQRIMAPCCWVQTLDVHDSPIAKELRAEIHTRLSRGESSSAIEADLVQRYGTRIVAMPASNPLAKLAAVVVAVVLAAGFLVARALRRWTRRDQSEVRSAQQKAPATSGPDEWDARLDEELRD